LHVNPAVTCWQRIGTVMQLAGVRVWQEMNCDWQITNLDRHCNVVAVGHGVNTDGHQA